MNETLRSGAKIAAALFAFFFIAAPIQAKEARQDKADAAHVKSEPVRKKAAAPGKRGANERKNADRRSADYERKRAEYERKRVEFERRKAELARKKADLDDVHRKIGNLHQEIAESEATRNEVADALSVVERAISASQKRLREISTERSDTEAEIAEMEKRRDLLSLQLVSQRRALGDTLYRYYVFGRKAGARRLLGGDDLNQVARDAYYLERMAEARQAEIQRARTTLAEHEKLIAGLQQKHQRMEALEREQASEHDRLLVEQGKRAKVLASVQGKLRVQRKEVASLTQDETRLGLLIGGLARLPPPKPPVPPPVPKPQPPAKAQPKPVAQPPSKAVASQPVARPLPTKPAVQPARPAKEASEPVSGHASEVADASVGGEAFAALKGKLKWPARGELIGRFGAARAEGGSQWKGIFIRATGGDVHAVAAGRVVYADWLRGFGNLIIIDHGNEYMTVYGNNEALFKAPGAHVRAGETIASVGSSGGSENSGLYFEIRYRGAPQDPAKWVAGR
ncbi:murein hydrolase activator EnvC family protein [Niveibacterium terrae]|uniref:murein hydrolase activator EnvC family protein n=1 Tax=Niveibacterium terrae TaxID=3373598 RepID=UPI003A8E8C32